MSSSYAISIAAATALSLGGHLALFESLAGAARRSPDSRRAPIEMAMLAPKPAAPEPESKPLPPPPPPKARRPKRPVPVRPPTPEPEPVSNSQTPPDAAAESAPPPVFGVTLSSVVGPGQGAGGFRVRVGNTLMKAPEKEATPAEEVRPLRRVERPKPIHALETLPRKLGECDAGYPEEARSLRLEGNVRLEVEVRADGRVGRVRVTRGLDPRLDRAAVRALEACHFEPGRADGSPVATVIPYTYRFVIEG